ncbi:MAG: hypothetical protein U5L05_17775 [Rubrivivax sp.]|nr:hypothetical protein [Rubrivivax sp.]
MTARTAVVANRKHAGAMALPSPARNALKHSNAGFIATIIPTPLRRKKDALAAQKKAPARSRGLQALSLSSR